MVKISDNNVDNSDHGSGQQNVGSRGEEFLLTDKMKLNSARVNVDAALPDFDEIGTNV